jgi:hypothetical protein
LIGESRSFEAEAGRDSASAEYLIKISVQLRDITELLINFHVLKKLMSEAKWGDGG